MHKAVAALIGVIFVFAALPAAARTFGDYECTDDCSGHKAGYEWAEARNIIDEPKCEAILRRWPNRNSFYEGVLPMSKILGEALTRTTTEMKSNRH